MAAKKAPPKPVARAAKKTTKKASKKATGKLAQRLASRTEENLSPKAKDRADRFVLQYLRDFNATQAFIRTQVEEGKPYEDVDYNYAMNQGYQMTRWPYVAQKIQEAIEVAEEKNIVTRAEVLYGFKREAHYMGMGSSHGARVGAWTALAKVLGMEQKKLEQNLAMKGGIMVVPATESLSSWEERAQAAQAALKEEVRK